LPDMDRKVEVWDMAERLDRNVVSTGWGERRMTAVLEVLKVVDRYKLDDKVTH
jgi:hypothetical protein